ncbi:Solute carrier family 35 member F6 [Smittium culicis]|uniref:Solute carrier family 35 member F6 n=1 Tax=Smittium culicis TaxID=133412 RepID=A0A1R1XWQ3_9FUNG|nr:Solute carrier family 35 member F6 [Smittium culicis]
MTTSMGFKMYLSFGMLISGTLNTLMTKMQNSTCVENCLDPDTKNHKFYSQPVLQTLNMFLGEMLCLIVYFAIKMYYHFTSDTNKADYEQIFDTPCLPEIPSTSNFNSGKPGLLLPRLTDEQIEQQIRDLKAEKPELSGMSNLLMSIPAICDIIASTVISPYFFSGLILVGFLFTTASVYQMLKGIVVIFVSLFSVKFLGHTLTRDQWISLAMIIIGTSIVGASSIVYSIRDIETSNIAHIVNTVLGNKANRSENIFGIVMIVLGQVFGAVMFISEEKIMQHYSYNPLKGVGLEGTFGALTVGILIPILHYTVGVNNKGGYFDASTGFSQIINNQSILNLCIYIMFSISMTNYFGLSITKAVSAASRSTIDSCR